MCIRVFVESLLSILAHLGVASLGHLIVTGLTWRGPTELFSAGAVSFTFLPVERFWESSDRQQVGEDSSAGSV